MRRKDRELKDHSQLLAILDGAAVLHLGLWDGKEVYVVPLNFVRIDEALYVHSAFEGRKIDILKTNPQVCFEVTGDYEIEPRGGGAHCTTRYESVIGWGKSSVLTDQAQKHSVLCALNQKFGASTENIPDTVVQRTAIVKITMEKLTGKSNRSGKKQ